MEAGQRGYILTGDSEFLEPYNQAKGIVETQMDSLNKLLSDNERQTNLLKGKIIAVVNNSSMQGWKKKITPIADF